MKIIGMRDDAEAFYNRELYSYKLNYYYVVLNELRCTYDFMEEHNALDMVVFEDAILGIYRDRTSKLHCIIK